MGGGRGLLQARSRYLIEPGYKIEEDVNDKEDQADNVEPLLDAVLEEIPKEEYAERQIVNQKGYDQHLDGIKDDLENIHCQAESGWFELVV